jgi:hypothetical protein
MRWTTAQRQEAEALDLTLYDRPLPPPRVPVNGPSGPQLVRGAATQPGGQRLPGAHAHAPPRRPEWAGHGRPWRAPITMQTWKCPQRFKGDKARADFRRDCTQEVAANCERGARCAPGKGLGPSEGPPCLRARPGCRLCSDASISKAVRKAGCYLQAAARHPGRGLSFSRCARPRHEGRRVPSRRRAAAGARRGYDGLAWVVQVGGLCRDAACWPPPARLDACCIAAILEGAAHCTVTRRWGGSDPCRIKASRWKEVLLRCALSPRRRLRLAPTSPLQQASQSVQPTMPTPTPSPLQPSHGRSWTPVRRRAWMLAWSRVATLAGSMPRASAQQCWSGTAAATAGAADCDGG